MSVNVLSIAPKRSDVCKYKDVFIDMHTYKREYH